MVNLPKSCEVNRFIPKNTFYTKTDISNSLKQEFTDKVEKIYWRYKISEEILNISKTEDVEEIEIFEIVLKIKNDCKNILNAITKNIPYKILFLLKYDDDFKYAIKYNDTIYYSDWNIDIDFNFSGLNLSEVYNNIVKAITNIDEEINDLDSELNKKNKIASLENEIEHLTRKKDLEKQFNRKVELNLQIQSLEKELKELKENG